MAGWGGWGWGNEWGGNAWKRKRDSEPKWKNNEHLDYANCALGSYAELYMRAFLYLYI
jgi:hypothetical protein